MRDVVEVRLDTRFRNGRVYNGWNGRKGGRDDGGESTKRINDVSGGGAVPRVRPKHLEAGVHCVTVTVHATSPHGTAGSASCRVFIACVVIAGWRVAGMMQPQ